MKCISKPTVLVKNSQDLVKCMTEAKDPWRQVQDLVTKATSEKHLSEKEGRKALMFSALWLAGNFKLLKEQNQVLQDRIQDLQDKIETLKISANTASALSIGHQKTVQENIELRKENGELSVHLRDAQGAIRSLSASFNHSEVDHSRCLMEIQSLKAQLRRRDAVIAAFNIPEADHEDFFIVNCDCLNQRENQDSHAYEFSSVPTHIVSPAILPMKSKNNGVNVCNTTAWNRESCPIRSGDCAPVTYLHINKEPHYKDVCITRTPLTLTDLANQTRELGCMGIKDMSRPTELSKIQNDARCPPAPVTVHINTGANCKATGMPRVETPLPSIDLVTLNRGLEPNRKIYDCGSLRMESATVCPVAPVTLLFNTGANCKGTAETKFDTPLLNKDLTIREFGAVKKGNDTGCRTAPFTGHINTGLNEKEIGRTRIERPLSMNEMAALSRKLGPIKVGDDPVETMLRIQTFRKLHNNIEDGCEVFNAVVTSLDQDLKANIPSSIYNSQSLDCLVNAVREILGWNEVYAHSAFVNCTQRKGEPIQAFADRLYTLYSLTRPAKPGTEDEVFKWALIKQSHPDICRLVGLSVGPSNTYVEVMDCLKRAESFVMAQSKNCEDKMAVLEAVPHPRDLRDPKESASKELGKCNGCSYLADTSKTSPLTFIQSCPEENATSHAELHQHLLELSQDLDIINQLRDQSNAHLSSGPFS
ncbi:uncharacterized protein LOC116407076 [Xenopus tropicalis]|uniref:Uncharacterized LOC116407076 n=1 Tax=Xenopus tropicalis TaxID=8364 RepID=A0A803JD75_XENTR|nr:uncharacterized protein LOC116407076 [Xenopus tropicalis]